MRYQGFLSEQSQEDMEMIYEAFLVLTARIKVFGPASEIWVCMAPAKTLVGSFDGKQNNKWACI